MLIQELFKNIELTEGVNTYLDRISSNKIGKLNQDALIKKAIPRDAIFFVFDTETTGLNFLKTDIVTEVACLAYDRNFNYIDRYHASAPVPDEETPIGIFNNSVTQLTRILDIEERLARRFARNILKRYLKISKGGAEKSKEEILYNSISNIAEKFEIDANERKLKSIYYLIFDLIKASDRKAVFKMTTYGKVKVDKKEPDEPEIARNFFEFYERIIEKTGTKNPIAVAHNYPYDYMMMRQAAGRAGISYKMKRFIDTAAFARKIIMKYMYATFMYYVDLSHEKGGRYTETAMKLKPTDNVRMGTLAQYFQIPNLQWHTAKNDVEATTEILKYLFAIDARFRDFFDKKPEVRDYIEEIEAEHGHKDFLHRAMQTPYLEAHKKAYREFMGEEKTKNSPRDNSFKTFKTKTSEEFPGTGVKPPNKKGFKVVKKGPRFKEIERESVI